MLTVACVLSKPIRDGHREYSMEHVDRLEKMVAEHLDSPYQFIMVVGGELPGWWAKLNLFQPGQFKGRVLYLDLDVTVCGPLDEVAYFEAPFAIMNDPNRFGFNSSVMSWNAGVADHLYTDFDVSVMERLTGDQDWITQNMPDARTFPRHFCQSYKRLQAQGRSKPDMRVLVFHGQPKPWDLPSSELVREFENG